VKTIRSLSQSVLVLSLLLALTFASAALGQESVVHGRIVGVTDGDTIKVLIAEKQLLRIRLAFCDAPEKKEAFGARAILEARFAILW
jgi:micrococcal nuclease